MIVLTGTPISMGIGIGQALLFSEISKATSEPQPKPSVLIGVELSPAEVDRLNHFIADLFDPYHPSIIRTLKRIIDKTHSHGKWVGLCGEVAADPLMTPILVGLGIDELSLVPKGIPMIKASIRQLNRRSCIDYCNDMLQVKTSEEAQQILHSISSESYSVV